MLPLHRLQRRPFRECSESTFLNRLHSRDLSFEFEKFYWIVSMAGRWQLSVSHNQRWKNSEKRHKPIHIGSGSSPSGPQSQQFSFFRLFQEKTTQINRKQMKRSWIVAIAAQRARLFFHRLLCDTLNCHLFPMNIIGRAFQALFNNMSREWKRFKRVE